MSYEEFDAYTTADLVDPGDFMAQAESDDPVVALAGIHGLREWVDEVEESAVLKARVEGMPWSRIGQLLGRSKQSVWEKHRSSEDETAES